MPYVLKHLPATYLPFPSPGFTGGGDVLTFPTRAAAALHCTEWRDLLGVSAEQYAPAVVWVSADPARLPVWVTRAMSAGGELL